MVVVVRVKADTIREKNQESRVFCGKERCPVYYSYEVNDALAQSLF